MKSVKLSIVSLTLGLEERGSVLAYVQKLSLALYGSLLPPSVCLDGCCRLFATAGIEGEWMLEPRRVG